jgi:hypothetical protein
MGNGVRLALLIFICAGLGCSGLRSAPELPVDGGSAGHGGHGGAGGQGGKPTDGGTDVPTCIAGLSCTAANPCRLGVTACESTGTVCKTTEDPQPNGTSCGENMVCTGGTCAACTAGTSCAVNGKPCRSGVISCASGAPVCTESADQPNGTPCGTGLVCQTGQCTPCQAGAACTPANPCHQGTLSCTTGTPQCNDTGTNAPAGTVCGTNKVCSAAGACGECSAGANCAVSGRTCRTGAISCSTGAPVCSETGNVANGTTCGTNMVCSTGSCVSCTVGLACTPTNPCHAGFTSCSPTMTCADSGANLVNGTVCGTNKVCSNGTCSTCTAGTSCQPTNMCRTGATSCVTGSSVCAETGNRPNGTTCGNNMVCNNGNCVACTAGTTCTPTNPCKTGKTSCSTGSSVCTESGNKPTGTVCGAAQSCTGGVVTSAAMCDQSQACVTSTMDCPGECNSAGTDCFMCPNGTTMCQTGCKNLSNDASNCGTCGNACTVPPVAGSGSAVCSARSCGFSCNTGYLECGGTTYCQVRSWTFEDGTTGGFTIWGNGQSPVTSLAASTTMSHGGNRALAIGLNIRGSTRRFEVGIALCGGDGYIPAMGQDVTAWFYLSPSSASVPAPHPDSAVGVHIYTNTDDDGDGRTPVPVGSWFRAQLAISSVGPRLEGISLEGFFDTDGTTDYNWSGTVYVDDISIQ